MRISRWIVCCGLIISMASSLYSQKPPDMENSCRTFVQQFYDWYLPKARTSKGRASDLVLRRKSAVLSPELAKGLKEDSDAQNKAKGELVGLDSDPFLNTQDPDFEKCVAGKPVCQAASCRVEVSCNFPGQQDGSRVTPELTFNHGQWLFVNFHYHFDSGNDDLLNMLKGLRQERKPKAK